jgi:hypothetical protein
MSAVNALIRVRPYLQAMASMDRAIGKPDVEVLNLLRIIDEAIVHPEPASEYDFSNVIHLTHHKAQDIIKRDGYVVTGFVLTKNKEGREYSKCIVDMSAVRWFDDGMVFFRMMHAPTPLVWKVDSQSLERMAEESECVKLSLDKAGVATADDRGDEYSLWGRVRLYANQTAPEQSVPELVSIPLENSQEAAEAIEKMMAEYGHPSNAYNAARAGWRAARLFAPVEHRPRDFCGSAEDCPKPAEGLAFDERGVLVPERQGDTVPVTNTEIKAAYVNLFGNDAKWFKSEGSYFIEGFKAGEKAASMRTKDLTDKEQLELASSSVGKSRHWLVAAAIAADREKNRA